MTNPLLRLDYPDPDVIRVGNTYYMVSTTMYFFPGCEILRSYDLINWEHETFVYDTLDSTDAQMLKDGKNIYSQGMWAGSLRYHNGTFYVVFICNDTHKTYLYTSDKISGPWTKSNIEGFYHDSSLLFDDDGRIYIVYGNREIYLTELKEDLSGPKEGGINKLIIKDSDETPLGYEGAHFYKINGKYYIFFIHSLKDRWMRAEACFISENPDGPYKGGDIFVDDLDYMGMGVAQGGIVNDPYGNWYAVLFQDRGAVGRIPYLLPLDWDGDDPKIQRSKEELISPKTIDLNPGYTYEALSGDDDFKRTGPSFGLRSIWQFNHEPDTDLFLINTVEGYYRITSDTLESTPLQAKNTITQRLFFPRSHCEVTLDASGLKEGDVAGLMVLQSIYGLVGVKKKADGLYMFMEERVTKNNSMTSYEYEVMEHDITKIDSEIVTLSFDADFLNMKDEVTFNIGPAHKMYFKLDHFTGNRAALFMYSTKQTGGSAVFKNFILRP